jgi:hypothetical protein
MGKIWSGTRVFQGLIKFNMDLEGIASTSKKSWSRKNNINKFKAIASSA